MLSSLKVLKKTFFHVASTFYKEGQEITKALRSSIRYRFLSKKNYPQTNYTLTSEKNYVERYFQRLCHSLIHKVQAKYKKDNQPFGPVIETGWIQNDYRYFFLKKANNQGWLFEQSETGWLVSRSEKIVKDDTFVRKGAAWDIVSIYRSSNPHIDCRVSSGELTKGEVVSYLVYENKIATHILKSF